VTARDWLDPVRAALDAAAHPVVFSVRDDDVGWADERLLELLELFAAYATPLDLAVIPAALEPGLASELRGRQATGRGALHYHQHGYAHANHEPEGRSCEFGPSRTASAQRNDIEAGARRLEELLGATTPIFTPPWNRCTETTGQCLREVGFHAVARDATAPPLGVVGLRELHVDVDWCGHGDGVADRLAARVRAGGPARIMLHHAVMGRRERGRFEPVLALLASHPNARCEPLAASARPGASAWPPPPGRRS
jgi:hypothetical protein